MEIQITVNNQTTTIQGTIDLDRTIVYTDNGIIPITLQITTPADTTADEILSNQANYPMSILIPDYNSKSVYFLNNIVQDGDNLVFNLYSYNFCDDL